MEEDSMMKDKNEITSTPSGIVLILVLAVVILIYFFYTSELENNKGITKEKESTEIDTMEYELIYISEDSVTQVWRRRIP
jgi:lipopolysaccharide export system protein LptC